jgi:hypothetical protein
LSVLSLNGGLAAAFVFGGSGWLMGGVGSDCSGRFGGYDGEGWCDFGLWVGASGGVTVLVPWSGDVDWAKCDARRGFFWAKDSRFLLGAARFVGMTKGFRVGWSDEDSTVAG